LYVSGETDGQRLDLKQLLDTPRPGVHVYICGPRRMIGALRDVAAEQGWPDEQIRFESFGARSLSGDRPVEVQLERSGRSLTVPAETSILDALLDAGVAVPHDCKRGECSLCMTRVLDGEPEHRDLCLSAEEKADAMCVCVSRARGENLRLDL
jgi:vanillate O-demethylase ferredoxin subunit